MKIFNLKNKQGFTLIELLVVVSIMSLLSSLILTSVSSARAKSKDSAVEEEVFEMRTVLQQNYNDFGTYVKLQPGLWVPGNTTCDLAFSGGYAPRATAICQDIYNNTGNANGGSAIFFGNSVSNSNFYSVMAQLPSQPPGTFFCMGSSGSTSTNGAAPYTQPGCSANP